MDVIEKIKNEMVCANDCPIKTNPHYDIDKRNCYKAEAIRQIQALIKLESEAFPKKIQSLFDSTIRAIEEHTAKEEINKAAGHQAGQQYETGYKLAYMDIARRLVGMGAKATTRESE